MTSSVTSPRVLSPISSSFDYLSSNIHSREASDSSDSYASLSSDDISSDEDEIVWSFSDLSSGSPGIRSQRALSPGMFSDEDIIVVSRPRSRAVRFQSLTAEGGNGEGDDAVDSLSRTLAKIEIKQTGSKKAKGTKKATSASAPSTPTTPSTKRRNRRRKATASEPQTPVSTSQPSTPKKKSKKKAPAVTPTVKKVKKVESTLPKAGAASDDAGLGKRPIVDDISEAGDNRSVVSGYEEAHEFVTSMLSDPSPKKSSNLAFLHALIIELGIVPASRDQETLPTSIKSAKTLLKSQVFLNVKDYLALRHEGLDALRRVMHPSRKALVKDIRGKSARKVPRDVVKKSGLAVLLVTAYQ